MVPKRSEERATLSPAGSISRPVPELKRRSQRTAAMLQHLPGRKERLR